MFSRLMHYHYKDNDKGRFQKFKLQDKNLFNSIVTRLLSLLFFLFATENYVGKLTSSGSVQAFRVNNLSNPTYFFIIILARIQSSCVVWLLHSETSSDCRDLRNQ